MTVDIEAMIARGSDEELEHYGVKGMKWGVTRSDAELARAAGERKKVESLSVDQAGGGGGGTGGDEELSEEEFAELLEEAGLTMDEADGLSPALIRDWIKNGKSGNFNKFVQDYESRATPEKDFRVTLAAANQLRESNKKLIDSSGGMRVNPDLVDRYVNGRKITERATTTKSGNTTTTTEKMGNYTRVSTSTDIGKEAVDAVKRTAGNVADKVGEGIDWLKKLGHSDILDMTADDALAHFGIKGMKWGVRRSDKQLAVARGVADRLSDARGQDRTALVKTGKGYSTGDAIAAAEFKSIAKQYGTSALTNSDLKQLNERLNLEANYAKLTPKQKTKLQKTLDGIATANKVNKQLGNPVGKAAAALITKQAAKSNNPAAKAAAAAAAAASAGKKQKQKQKSAPKATPSSSTSMPKAGQNLDITLSAFNEIAQIGAASPQSLLSDRPKSK